MSLKRLRVRRAYMRVRASNCIIIKGWRGIYRAFFIMPTHKLQVSAVFTALSLISYTHKQLYKIATCTLFFTSYWRMSEHSYKTSHQSRKCKAYAHGRPNQVKLMVCAP